MYKEWTLYLSDMQGWVAARAPRYQVHVAETLHQIITTGILISEFLSLNMYTIWCQII